MSRHLPRPGTHPADLLSSSSPPPPLQVAEAKATTDKISTELVDLKKTLQNINDARPIEDLMVRGGAALSSCLRLILFRRQVEDVIEAIPEIQYTVDTMVSKGKFTVPGYKEKVGRLTRRALSALSLRSELTLPSFS